MPGQQTLERQVLMGLSSCSDPSTGPSENFWLSNAWDVLTVLGLGQRPALFLGGEAAVEVLGLGVLCGLLRPTRPHPPPPPGDSRVLCSLPCLSGTSDWGLPGTGFQGVTHPGIATVWALGFPKLSLEEAVQVSCSRGQRKALASLGGRVV